MRKLNKITRIKFGLLCIYFFNLFLPIYKQNFLGSTARASVVDLNAGVVFLLIFFFLILATIVTFFFDEKLHRLTFLSSLSFMILFLGIVLFFKENTSILAIAFYVQILLIGKLILVFVHPSFAIRIYDSLISLSVNSTKWAITFSAKLYHSMVNKYKMYKQKSNDKDSKETSSGKKLEDEKVKGGIE